MKRERSKRRQKRSIKRSERSQSDFIFDGVLTFIALNSGMALAFLTRIYPPFSANRDSAEPLAQGRAPDAGSQERGVRIKSQAERNSIGRFEHGG